MGHEGPSLGHVQKIAYGLALGLITAPYFIFGPSSFISTGDNIGNAFSFILAWVRGDFISWFPWLNGGLDAESAGVTADLALLLFSYLPPWPGYALVTLARIGLCAVSVFWIVRRVLGLSSAMAWPAAMFVIAGGWQNMVFSDGRALAFVVAVPIGMIALRYPRPFLLDKARLWGMAGLMGLAYGMAGAFMGLIAWYFLVPLIVIACLVQLSWGLRFSLMAMFMLGFLAYISGEIVAIIEKSAFSHRTLMDSYSQNTFDDLTFDRLIGNVRGWLLLISLLIAPLFMRGMNEAGRIFVSIQYALAALWVMSLAGMPLLFDLYPPLRGVNLSKILTVLHNFSTISLMIILQAMVGGKARLLAQALVLYVAPVLVIGYIISLAEKKATQWLHGGNEVAAYDNPVLREIAEGVGGPGQFRVDMVNPSFGTQPLAVYGLETVGGYVNIYPARYWHFFSMIENPDRPEGREGSSYLKARYEIGPQNELYLACDVVADHSLLIDHCLDLDILALFNVRYLISRNPMKDSRLRLVEGPDRAWHAFSIYEKLVGAIAENFGARPHLFIYELMDVQPRAFVVSSVEIVEDWRSLKSEMNKRTIRDLRRTALVLAEDAPADGWLSEMSGGAGWADVELFAGDRMEVGLDIRAAGVLVVGNSYDPDWIAEIDGEPRPVVPVYGALWGVRVEPGDKQAVFRFQPAHAHLNRLF